MEHVKEILGGLALLVFVLAVIGAFFLTGQSNGRKEQQMNEVCVDKGYTGWDDDGCHR